MIRRPSRMVWLCVALIGVTPPVLAQTLSSVPPPLSLPDAQRIALDRAPRLAGIAAQAHAAREMAVAAGTLPDPVLKLGVSNIPVSGEMAWSATRDSMSMRTFGVMQEFTRGEKREAARARDEQMAELALVEAQRTRSEIARDTALAWLELDSLLRQQALLEEQVAAVRDQEQAAAAFRGGRGEQVEIFAMRTEAENMRSMLTGLDGEIGMARARLTRWLGESPATLAATPDISRLAWDWRSDSLDQHPTIALLTQQVALAEADARLARARRKPDLGVELMYGRRSEVYGDMISVTVSMPLQWNIGQRQDRELASSLSMADQVRAEQEDMRRAYRAELEGMHAAWQSALARLAHAERTLIPLAEQQQAATLAAYRAGSGMLERALGARRAVLEARLARERVALEAARAWAQLNFLDAQTIAQGARP
ncbi:MAG: transporter [Candidatus Dactylopiibacterium carminicum]|uniref:TolC family protein n=1 Tax=Candidatus Dactylopiibacterium carminicum TaxID=857335 RepID=A0A272EXE1_9RHOO|nr:TolC family protein [Candidatus Dactylopiibacterium carminicum]KAF7600221.1 TolC family protein [Candidatus Dactylopiibacterium carminicum]PAS94761.1 MAG: transporter [Candidatus Dactylopiibacterium carminicum]PAT00217.1 MAG: hypothetical protein BSR46_04025 [Candidatus Dactylopiibacterium carminicum]